MSSYLVDTTLDLTMRIWLINPYGPLPNEAWRETRFASIGRALAARGHEVVWWTANFSHHSKHFRSDGWATVRICPGFLIKLVPTASYADHVSIRRLRFEAKFALGVLREARKASHFPEVIISADATMAWGHVAVHIAKKLHARLIVDIIDLWPEIFESALPAAARPLAPLLLAPLYWLRRMNLRRANGISAVSDSYLAIAQRERGRSSIPCQFATVYWGCISARDRTEPPANLPTWKEKLHKTGKDVFAVFAGTLGANYDIPTLLEAAEILSRKHQTIRFLIAGAGPRAEGIRLAAASSTNNNLVFLGELSAAELKDVYAISDIGLSVYFPGSFVAMPIKFFDYIAAGLPIVNSLIGDIARQLTEKKIGLNYVSGDPQSLANTLASLADDPVVRATMSARARLVAQEFDHDVQYSRFAEFVEAVAAN